MKYRIQGEVTIFIDYVDFVDYADEDAESEEIALKAAKEWLTRVMGTRQVDETLDLLGGVVFAASITGARREL